jgi:uncharacterized protein
MSLFAAAVALGLVGSGHCLLMCGPLVLTFRPGAKARVRQISRTSLYHGGRLLTYASLGVVAGTAGHAVSAGGFGRALALVGGAMLLVTAAGAARPVIAGRAGRAWSRVASGVCARVGRWSRSHGAIGIFGAGMANGLLPCGLVYAAVTAAAALGGPLDAAIFMIGFGLGTVPALIALSFSARRAPARVHTWLRRAMPVVLTAVAVLLISRGLSDPAVASACRGHVH